MYKTDGFCTSVISSSNMLKNFTSFTHADIANVIFLWVFDEHFSSVTPSVATRPLALFLVYLSVTWLESQNITILINIGFLTMTSFVFFPFRYQIRHPNAFQCSGPVCLMCTSKYLATFPMWGTILVLYHINIPKNDL